jgi:hypothetical protein
MMDLATTGYGSLLRWGAALVALAAFLALPAAADAHHRAGHDRGPRAGTEIADSYIVILRPGASPAALTRAHGVRSPRSFQAAFNGFAGVVPAGRLAALRNDPRVETIIPDRTIRALPGRPRRGNTTGSITNTETVPEGIKRIAGDPASGLGVTGAGVGIAVLDSGWI